MSLTIMQKKKQMDWLTSMQAKLTNIADDMDASGMTSMEAMADHIDCINDEIQFQIDQILADGPIVMFKDGKCTVRSATGN